MELYRLFLTLRSCCVNTPCVNYSFNNFNAYVVHIL